MGKRSTKFYRKNEVEVMERLGFKPTINSGSGWIQKEDGENNHSLCQLKSTDKQSMSIKQNDLHILENNAVISHKIPVFAIQFLNTDEVWVMIKPDDLSMVQSLIEGDCISDELRKTDVFAIDSEEETEYNQMVSKNHDANKSYSARLAYQEQIKQEREHSEQEFKNKIRERKKQNGKKV